MFLEIALHEPLETNPIPRIVDLLSVFERIANGEFSFVRKLIPIPNIDGPVSAGILDAIPPPQGRLGLWQSYHFFVICQRSFSSGVRITKLI